METPNPYTEVYAFSEHDYMRLLALEDELTPIAVLCARGSRVKLFKDANADKVGTASVLVQIDDDEIAAFLAQLLRRCGYCVRLSLADPKHRSATTNCVQVLLVPPPTRNPHP